MWGCMTSYGMGYMCKIEEKMTQALYHNILQVGVIKTNKWCCFNYSHVIFQHDNDPKQSAKLVNQWLSIQNLDVLTWPTQSPDLNPMKHVWALVKLKSNEYPTLTKGMLHLWVHEKASFNSINPEQRQKF